MRRLSESMVTLLTEAGGRRDVLRHHPEERPQWWLEAGLGVRAGVALSAIGKGYFEKTGFIGDYLFYSRTEAGRLALAEQEARDA